jgi:anti-repressor protein
MAGYAPAAPFHLTESEVIMNELITVNYDNEQPTVSARELHGFLEVGTRFGDWFPRMCEYGFEQGRDFNFLKNEQVRFEGNREVKRTVDDAEITIDMAKELCMLQRNDKGKQARQYFLQLERDWNSPEKVMARALQIAHKRIHTLSEKIEQDAPKVLFADSVAASHTSILIFDLAKIVKQNGVDMGGKRLFAWMRDNGYLVRRQGTDYNMPTQRSMELGLFEVKETSVTHSDGHISVNKTPKVTGKGQQYFINRLLGEENRSN